MNVDTIRTGQSKRVSASFITSIRFASRYMTALLCLLSCLLGPKISTIHAAERTPVAPRVASGDITVDRAIIWGQTDEVAEMEVEYAVDSEFINARRVKGAIVNESSDFAGHIELQDLAPATQYFYRVSFRADNELQTDVRMTNTTGTFRTAPLPASPATVRFVFSGDLGGQGYCRHAVNGYRIFSAMLERPPDFFVENGDFIYADGTCPAQGPAGWSNVPGTFAGISDGAVDWTDRTRVSAIYRDHWRYQLEDEHLSKFLRHVPLYPQWDDHEVINDAGWGWDYWNSDTQTRAGFENLVEAGRETFFQHLPIRRNSADRQQIYRLHQWGKTLM